MRKEEREAKREGKKREKKKKVEESRRNTKVDACFVKQNSQFQHEQTTVCIYTWIK